MRVLSSLVARWRRPPPRFFLVYVQNWPVRKFPFCPVFCHFGSFARYYDAGDRQAGQAGEFTAALIAEDPFWPEQGGRWRRLSVQMKLVPPSSETRAPLLVAPARVARPATGALPGPRCGL